LYDNREDAYIEYFGSIPQLKKRILDLTKIWLKKHPYMDESLLYRQENNIYDEERKR